MRHPCRRSPRRRPTNRTWRVEIPRFEMWKPSDPQKITETICRDTFGACSLLCQPIFCGIFQKSVITGRKTASKESWMSEIARCCKQSVGPKLQSIPLQKSIIEKNCMFQMWNPPKLNWRHTDWSLPNGFSFQHCFTYYIQENVIPSKRTLVTLTQQIESSLVHLACALRWN